MKETSSTKCSSPADTDLKCKDGMEHLFICSSCGDHLKYGLWNRLNEKIVELEKEVSWNIKNPRVFHPSAFLYYLKLIRGDPPTDVKQECPFDN